MKKYRYPGLNAYLKNDAAIFKGRDDDAKNLLQHIRLNKTLVLHADSGVGKSSLIQAGLLPLLEKTNEKLIPVIIRLTDLQAGKDKNLLLDFVIAKVFKTIPRLVENPFTIPSLPEATLWNLNKRAEKQGASLLLIFDQFEMLQGFTKKQVEILKQELFYLLSPKIPLNIYSLIEEQMSREDEGGNVFHAEYELLSSASAAKVLFVVREDKLGTMALLSDRFPDILKNDLIIEPLSKDDAFDAIREPAMAAGDFISEPFSFENDQIIKELIGKIADEDTSLVDPVLLQIVASSIERKKKVIITNEDIPEVSNIVIKHYNDTLENIRKDLNLTESQISEYKKNILPKFVINDRRTLVDSESIQTNHIKFIKELVERGLIREIPGERNAIYYQLVHDRIIGPITSDPNILKANYFEKYFKSIKFANKVAIISILPLLLSWIFIETYYFNYSTQLEKSKIEIDSLNRELFSSQNERKKFSDSIVKTRSQNKKLLNDSVRFDSLEKSQKRLNEQQDSVRSKLIKLASYHDKKIDENALLRDYTAPPLLRIVITLVNVIFLGLVLFFQFARRISMKYIFKEIHIYKTKRISDYDKIELFLPFWLSPINKTNYSLLSSVKPVDIFNKTFRTNFTNFIFVLSLLIIVAIQFRLIYISYAFRDANSDLIFYLNVLFLLFSILVATTWFTPLNDREYNNEKENPKILSRKDFITISIYSILATALFKLKPILSENKKPRYTGVKKPRYTGIKNPRYRVKKLKPQFNLPDHKSQIVINKKSKTTHFVDDKGFSLALKSIRNYKDFKRFKQNTERFNQLDKLAIKGKLHMPVKYLSWNAENIALYCLKSGRFETAVKVLLSGIQQSYKSSLRLTDLLVLICIRHNSKVPTDTLNQLINQSAISKDKKLIARLEKWKNQNWRNKILKRPKVVFNKTEI